MINEEHPFYRRVYEPLGQETSPKSKELRCQLDLLLLSAARAEAQASRRTEQSVLKKFRQNWSDIMATFLGR